MTGRTETRIIGALGAVIFVALVVMAGALAVGLSKGETGSTTLVQPTATSTSAIPIHTLPPEKQAAVDAEASARAAALANPPSPGATKNEVIVAQTDAPLRLGIFPAIDVQIRGYIFNTAWRDVTDEGYITIWAGRLEADATRGVILVWLSNRGYGFTHAEWYETPPGSGSLRIVSADGRLLSLTSKSGQTFSFDAETRELMDASGNVVPTDTPTPAGYMPPKPTYAFPSPLPEGATATPAPPG